MYLYILIDVRIRIYLHTLNISVCYEYTVAGMGTQMKCRFKEPLIAEMTEDVKKRRGCVQTAPTVYSAYSLFLKKENGRRRTPESAGKNTVCWP